LNSPSISISQSQLESASPENLLRLAEYLKLNNIYEVEHEYLAFVVSMVLADQFLNSCNQIIYGL